MNANTSFFIPNEYLYNGRRLDPVTGLQLNRNRFYASHLGRWVNRDPIRYVDGYNLYAACFVPDEFDPPKRKPKPDLDDPDVGEWDDWNGYDDWLDENDLPQF